MQTFDLIIMFTSKLETFFESLCICFARGRIVITKNLTNVFRPAVSLINGPFASRCSGNDLANDATPTAAFIGVHAPQTEE